VHIPEGLETYGMKVGDEVCGLLTGGGFASHARATPVSFFCHLNVLILL
jgi:hypothetical protein